MTDTWASVKPIQADPIFGLVEEFKKDTSDKKISLVVGAYRDDNDKPYIFPVVDKVEHLLLQEKVNKEYLPVSGFKDFIDGAKKLVFGDDAKFDNISSFQTLSGTGSLYIGGIFLNKFYKPGFKILIPDPSWPIHDQVFQLAGVSNQSKYKCYDNATNTLAFDNMIKSITEAEDGAVLLLHACAHNPTGTDPSKEQWATILKLCQAKKILPFFDLAYQGFASGSFEEDAYAVRLFYKAGMQMIVAESFAKNAGLYGERVGALHIVCTSPEIANNVKTNVERIVRSAYSNPPIHGAYIMGRILKDKTLFSEWAEQLKQVANRIQQMRVSLRSEIEKLKTPGDWSHITKQIGMFSYTGLSEAQCLRLMKEHHIYLLKSGRISMSGVNTKNVVYLAKAINEVVLAVKL